MQICYSTVTQMYSLFLVIFLISSLFLAYFTVRIQFIIHITYKVYGKQLFMSLVRLLKVLEEPKVIQEFSTGGGGISAPKPHTLQGSFLYIHEVARARCQGHWLAVSLREQQETGKWERRGLFFFFISMYILTFFNVNSFPQLSIL